MRTEKVEMRPVLKYPGSKWKMAEWIISLMPPHKSYLEPFCGRPLREIGRERFCNNVNCRNRYVSV